MADMTYCGPVDDIDAFVADCQFSPDAYVLVEQSPLHVVTDPKERQNLLLFTRPVPDIHLNTYTSGRVFDQNAEVRWERAEQTEVQDGKFHVVYIGPDNEQLPGRKDAMQKKRLTKPRTTSYFLFGERLDSDDIKKIGPPAEEGDFAQLRIPRLLRYPRLPKDPSARRLRLEVYEYVDEDTGQVRLFRFRGLQAGE